VVGFFNGGSDGNGCSFYLFETGDRARFLFLHRFVKFLELLLFACQVFGEVV
jgi:hypothetical protein